MLLVVADSSPIRYLVTIGEMDLLARLFAKVMIPTIVARELRHPSAPAAVQAWMNQPPIWVEIWPVAEVNDPALGGLDPGEKAAIALGLALKADLLLIDDRRGAAVAARRGFAVTGTLGILDLGAQRGWVDLKSALDRLTRTNFRYRPELLAALLAKHFRGNIG